MVPPALPGLPVWFPPPPPGRTPLEERLAAGAELPDVHCPACGERGAVGGFTDNLRESGYCPSCGAWSRIRQMAAVLVVVAPGLVVRPPAEDPGPDDQSVAPGRNPAGPAVGRSPGGSGPARPLAVVADLATLPGLRVYNTEAHGTLHGLLGGMPGYVASEYFGPGLRSGQTGPGGVRHEDLQDLSFPDGRFDLVLSTDVFEHVADPYRGHREVHRVLRPGGHHVFTVPFDEDALLDDVRATMGPDGTVHHWAEPVYHPDPVRAEEGALVYTVFGLEMLVELAALGMDTVAYRPAGPERGLVGGGLVFDAVRRR